MENRVAIVGAGVSGLLACKYALEKGFRPIVFEADETVGGCWAHTLDSTKLQNIKDAYRFSDFPWPCSVKDVFPSHSQVMEYLQSYALHFGLSSYIKFNSKVLSIDYVGESYEEIESWHLWGGTGKPFGSNGKWHIRVQDAKSCTIEVYQAEFVILCIGQFSGLPNIPDLPPDQGPDVFHGKVLHVMDYTALNSSSAQEFVKNKRVTIIGSHKSAMDLAAVCANINGPKYPCTVIQRTAHWFLPNDSISGYGLGLLYFNRLAGFLDHKPGETFLLRTLATLLSPLRLGISKLVECYLKWRLPLKKYGLLPKYRFYENVYAIQIAMTPENFVNRLEEGSIVIKNSTGFKFCREGLIIDGETKPLETDIVIFATGFKGDQKLKNIFASPVFQKYIMGSPTSTLPLYRQIIHPRIPQLAIIGYSESLSNLTTSEIRCQWLTQFLGGRMELPSITEMEKDIKIWDEYIKKYNGKYFRRSSIGAAYIWYNDQLCRDMGRKTRRKKGIFAELFAPYAAQDYVALTDEM
ncbi:Dimethylaniline monooxygenase, N-oxide-forming [Corchorus olitorius]|uniref:Flavin-containing monooxygenase n=1 Tax=Corchorus olitorius TaxID=93759 RepID=A0A1R3ICP7_9ROSI|nr:Dimethylaniline monooxygenase, N-oxide-forming [Corchorus olitorius]